MAEEDAKTESAPQAKKTSVAEPATLEYRYVGSHAYEMADGSPVEPGQFVKLTEEQARETHNEMLFADGNLIGIDEASEHEASLASRRVQRRENKDGEE